MAEVTEMYKWVAEHGSGLHRGEEPKCVIDLVDRFLQAQLTGDTDHLSLG